MEITPQCVVALTWTLKDTLGEVLDVLDEPVEFLVGGERPARTRSRRRCRATSRATGCDLHLEPEDAFGDFDDQLLFLEPRALFPAELEEGMTFDGAALPAAPARTAARRDLHRDRDLSRTRGARRQPSAGRHRAAAAPEGGGGARSDRGRRSAAARCGTGFFKVQLAGPGQRPAALSEPDARLPRFVSLGCRHPLTREDLRRCRCAHGRQRAGRRALRTSYDAVSRRCRVCID